jgi:hypothetical protein
MTKRYLYLLKKTYPEVLQMNLLLKKKSLVTCVLRVKFELAKL